MSTKYMSRGPNRFSTLLSLMTCDTSSMISGTSFLVKWGGIEFRMKIYVMKRQRGMAPEASSDPFDLLEPNPALCGMIGYLLLFGTATIRPDWANTTQFI
jgi:hypothetical protein